jgi:hypothetical protein
MIDLLEDKIAVDDLNEIIQDNNDVNLTFKMYDIAYCEKS